MGHYLAYQRRGHIGLVDTAQFIGGRSQRDNNPTPGRADVLSSAIRNCFTTRPWENCVAKWGKLQLATGFSRAPACSS